MSGFGDDLIKELSSEAVLFLISRTSVSNNVIFSRACSHTIRPRAVGDWRGKMEEGK